MKRVPGAVASLPPNLSLCIQSKLECTLHHWASVEPRSRRSCASHGRELMSSCACYVGTTTVARYCKTCLTEWLSLHRTVVHATFFHPPPRRQGLRYHAKRTFVQLGWVGTQNDCLDKLKQWTTVFKNKEHGNAFGVSDFPRLVGVSTTVSIPNA